MNQNQVDPNLANPNQGKANQANPDQGSSAQQPTKNSYVDSYQPPTTPSSQNSASDQNSTQTTSIDPVNSEEKPAPVVEQQETQEPQETQEQDNQVAASDTDSEEQSLKAQNIFFLLGVTDSSNEEKEAFLDELQQVVWEDFIENDLELLITKEEKETVDQLIGKEPTSEMQEELAVKLEELIPDLEEIIFEKALELKSDMVKERITGMREYYAGKPEDLAKIDQAEALISQDQWRAAAEVLNAI